MPPARNRRRILEKDDEARIDSDEEARIDSDKEGGIDSDKEGGVDGESTSNKDGDYSSDEIEMESALDGPTLSHSGSVIFLKATRNTSNFKKTWNCTPRMFSKKASVIPPSKTTGGTMLTEDWIHRRDDSI